MHGINKKLNQAIHKQLDKIAHSTLSSSNIPSIELAGAVSQHQMTKVFYTPMGVRR